MALLLRSVGVAGPAGAAVLTLDSKASPGKWTSLKKSYGRALVPFSHSLLQSQHGSANRCCYGCSGLLLLQLSGCGNTGADSVEARTQGRGHCFSNGLDLLLIYDSRITHSDSLDLPPKRPENSVVPFSVTSSDQTPSAPTHGNIRL
ncbi:hypothetical protein KP509_21G082700 [Ceratopteris richardii]|uniref:Uncharacterized protein n=1 Tax=Ceratopteris richardii TaxID=49495 RepID=A0A8T2SBX6_CERRI|nr:hypothetical protein KP509_21G082700 [Ceratopteris richardii]